MTNSIRSSVNERTSYSNAPSAPKKRSFMDKHKNKMGMLPVIGTFVGIIRLNKEFKAEKRDNKQIGRGCLEIFSFAGTGIILGIADCVSHVKAVAQKQKLKRANKKNQTTAPSNPETPKGSIIRVSTSEVNPKGKGNQTGLWLGESKNDSKSRSVHESDELTLSLGHQSESKQSLGVGSEHKSDDKTSALNSQKSEKSAEKSAEKSGEKSAEKSDHSAEASVEPTPASSEEKVEVKESPAPVVEIPVAEIPVDPSVVPADPAEKSEDFAGMLVNGLKNLFS